MHRNTASLWLTGLGERKGILGDRDRDLDDPVPAVHARAVLRGEDLHGLRSVAKCSELFPGHGDHLCMGSTTCTLMRTVLPIKRV